MGRLVDMTDEASIHEYLAAKDNLNNLLFQVESYWKQRTKLFWLAENTKFFHSSASARKKLNHIEYLFDDNDVRVTDQEGMCAIILKYFSDLAVESYFSDLAVKPMSKT